MRTVRFLDTLIYIFLCAAIACLPSAKAGLEICVWGAFFLFICKRFFGYRTDGLWTVLPRTPLDRMLIVFFLAGVVSTAFSVDIGLSFHALLGKQLKALVVFFMVVEAVNSGRRLGIFLMVMLLTAILVGADAAAQYIRGVDLVHGIEPMRLTASFSNPNNFAGWLTIVIPVFIGVLFIRGIPFLVWKTKAVFMVVIAVLLVCLILTYSRGAWLGITAGSLMCAGYGFRAMCLKKKVGLFFIALFAVAGVLVFSQRIVAQVDSAGHFQARFGQTLDARIRSIPDSEDASTTIRIKLWKEAFAIWKGYPLTGAGLNTYARISPKEKTFKESGWYPHNCYLQMAAETGLIGLLAFLWVIFGFFRAGFRHIQRYEDLFVLGLVCGIFSFLVHSAVDSNLYELQLVAWFWFMLGLAVAVMRLRASPSAV